MKNTYKFADICVTIDYTSDYFTRFASGYETEEPASFSVAVAPSDIAAERARALEDGHSDPYLETLAIYRKICSALVFRDILLFHCSALAVDGRAYLFAAPSGTGKSTHARLWRDVYGDRVTMINDDKPLLRVTDNGVTVFGTPWNGKHRLSANISAPAAGLCILQRGANNRIEPLRAVDALPRLIAQTYRPEESAGAVRSLELVLKLAKLLPMWRLECNMDLEAARVAYETMKGSGS